MFIWTSCGEPSGRKSAAGVFIGEARCRRLWLYEEAGKTGGMHGMEWKIGEEEWE